MVIAYTNSSVGSERINQRQRAKLDALVLDEARAADRHDQVFVVASEHLLDVSADLVVELCVEIDGRTQRSDDPKYQAPLANPQTELDEAFDNCELPCSGSTTWLPIAQSTAPSGCSMGCALQRQMVSSFVNIRCFGNIGGCMVRRFLLFGQGAFRSWAIRSSCYH